MAQGETPVTIAGNLTADPEIRYTQSGLAVVSVTVASTPRSFDRQANEWKDDDALFLRINCWRDMAENVAASLHKGMRVVAYGYLKQKNFEDKEGNKRSSIELEVEDIGPSLKFSRAEVTRNQSSRTQQDNRQRAAAPADEPWAPTPPASGGGGDPWADETPF